MTKTAFEPTSQSIPVLLELIAKESAVPRKRLMIDDYIWKSRQLSENERHGQTRRILESFVPEDIRSKLAITNAVSDDRRIYGATREFDIAIVTIIEPEKDMLLMALGLDKKAKPNIVGDDRYWHASIPSYQASRNLSIIVTMVGEPKEHPCAAAVSRLLNRFEVGACILVGIAAGLKDKVKLGTTLVADEIFYYHGQRREEKGGLPRTDRVYPPRSMKADLLHFSINSPELQNRFVKLLVELEPSQLPKVNFSETPFIPRNSRAIIASGEDLIADGSLRGMRDNYDERIRGAEQEGFGFANSCERASSRQVPWAVFRGVSDYGEKDKEDDWHYISSLSAAVTALEFLSRSYRPPETGTAIEL